MSTITKEDLLRAKRLKLHVPDRFVIGSLYHCDWAWNRGYVWVLADYDEKRDVAHMVTPRTGKIMTTKLSSLRDTNDRIIQRLMDYDLGNKLEERI